ncbi:MAG: hypothetical protein WCT11_04530 [Candidatus Magasanikbacteria bacterium]|jgi:hypothetical protein
MSEARMAVTRDLAVRGKKSDRLKSPEAVEATIISEKKPTVEDKVLFEKQKTEEERTEQMLETILIDEKLSSILIGEYIKSGDTQAMHEALRRNKFENFLREGEKEELLTIRTRKDADLTTAENCELEIKRLEQEVETIDDNDIDEKYKKFTEISDRQTQAFRSRVLNSEVRKIGLSGDDKAEAVFKPADGEPHIMVKGSDIGTLTNHIPRGHLREWLAGVVAKAIGAERVVPPTVIRKIDGRVGSVQAWVKEGRMAVEHFNWQTEANQGDLQLIATLDFVLENSDRHHGNFLEDENGRLVAIDHGAIFPTRQKKDVLSLPLRAVKEQSIDQKIVANLQEAIANPWKMELLEKAFKITLGDSAIEKFGEFKGRMETLVLNKKFGDYHFPAGFDDYEEYFGMVEDEMAVSETPPTVKKKLEPPTVAGNRKAA